MDATKRSGTRCPGKRFLGSTVGVVLLAATVSGCNFFGKLEEQPLAPTGRLSDGESFVGAWTTSSSATATDGRPSHATTETYTFDPTGAARVEVRDMRAGGITCTGIGQYRQTGARDVTIYLQAAQPATCGFAAQIRLSDVEVGSQTLSFKDPQTQYQYELFKVRAVDATAPVGVWDFDGAGGDQSGQNGIDYLFLDPKGYFLIQTTANGQQYLVIGYYAIASGKLTLSFFSNMDPAQSSGTPMIYKQFVTDGVRLNLVEETQGGDLVYEGQRI